MKTLSLKLPPSLETKLTHAARQRGTSKSSIVREALESFLQNNAAPKKGSALEAVSPWVGCVNGPGDLSTNPEYMDDFGK